jgi:hypothetical protein
MERTMNAPDRWQVTPQAAELYERYPVRYILGPWAPLLVDAARLKVGQRVLDVDRLPSAEIFFWAPVAHKNTANQ